jgi:hypothetical protein
MPDSSRDMTYWLVTEHVFTPAGWGEEFCRLCLQRESGEKTVHLDAKELPRHDPRRYHPILAYPIAVPSTTVWQVEGWSDDGGSCSYADSGSWEAALATIEDYTSNGDHAGRTYDHYLVHEVVRYLVCDDFIHPVEVTA